MKTRLYKRIMSALVALVTLVSCCLMVGFTDGGFFISFDGAAVTELGLAKNEKITVSAENLPEGAQYQWQICLPGSEIWVDIHAQTDRSLSLSYALLGSLLDADGAARVRCAAVSDEETEYTEAVLVTSLEAEAEAEPVKVENASAPDPLPAPVTETEVDTEAVAYEELPSEMATFQLSRSGESMLTSTDTNNEDMIIHTVTIEYVYGADSKFAGQRAAPPYIAEVVDGDTLEEGNVISPDCVGYEPNIASMDLSELGPITGNLSYTVTYSPAEVSYTVRHYQQNVDDDEYTWVDTTMASGKTEDLTSDSAAKDYTGFTALAHYHEEIAADSSTMVDIYYDRNYYLMSFELDGGYGAEPIYARYGADISVATPYKPGYTFAGWNSTIPATMPAENRTYTAGWTANSGIEYTVAYWLEDPNAPGSYNFWASVQRNDGIAGNPVQGETYKDYTVYLDAATVSAMDIYEKRYSQYSHADENIVIEGDGSTVINVYYSRNEYTLKFYYAMSSGSGTDAKYYVIGGSTYRFGASATISDNGNEIALLDHYMKDYSSERGQVDELPTLNASGSARGYTTGSDSSTVSGTQYQYHYISFTAKYGADISALWPCAVFNSVTRLNTDSDKNNTSWAGTEAFVSAWNGEHHVYYSQLNSGNQTIKGNYNELDYQLLFDVDKNYTDSSTVAYLCFWENGADIGWSIPELYRYNIYVPVLDGQDISALSTKEYKGTTYYLLATYDTVDNSSVGEQTAPAINGYSYTDEYTSETLHKSNGGQIIYNPVDNPILYDADGNLIYKEAHTVNFFYERESHTLKFVNGTQEYAQTVYFGEEISGKAPTNLEYYDDSLKDLYEFDGWYTTSNAISGTKFELSGTTMPDSALTLYANWTLITHDVKIYPTEADAKNGSNQIGTTVAVTHDQPVPEGSHPDESKLSNGDASFIGWFYKDAGGDERAFDFATMTITQDMTVYAKWRSNVMKAVEIHYVVEDSSGNHTQIADTESLMLRVGQARTFDAKTGNSLYEAYRTGCFPTTASHSITPTEDDLDSEEPISYTFVYKKYGKVPYQVEFYVQEADGTLRPAFKTENGKAVFMETYDSTATAYVEQHWNNDKAVVTELYIPDDLSDPTWSLPDNYVPSALKIQKIIVPSTTDPETNIEANTIRFVYTYTDPVVDPDNPGTPVYKARYLVQHFIQSSTDTSIYNLYTYSDEEGLSGETASASPISIPGYTYSYEVTDANKQTGTNLSKGTDGAADVMSGIIDADDSLELNFYYTVNSYPYQVMYLEETTNRILKETRTTDSNGNPLSGLYGSKVTENYEPIDGYDVDATSKSIYIQMEADSKASINTIKFYYKLKSAELLLTKTVELDATQAAQEGISKIPPWVFQQDFVFTIHQPDGYPKSVYHYTFKDADGNTTEKSVSAGTQDIVVSLKHGESIQLHDLPMGSYEVTETYVPGFRTSVNSYIAQTHPVTLDKDGEVETLAFLNSFPFYTGDLVIMKNVTKQDESDPDATEAYKVSVVLNPDNSTREVDRVITWKNAGATEESTFTVPALSETSTATEFTFEVQVPVGGEVKMEGVPVGSFIVTEEVKGSVGYIYDYYTVKYNKAVHENDEVTGTNHVVSGSIHGGHPTAVTFNNTYKKGSLNVSKTVTQEYENDNWQSATFTFTITGTTELPDGEYRVDGAIVNVSGGVVSVKNSDGNDPTISINKSEGTTSWSGNLSFSNLPAGYYTVTETSSTGGLEQYITIPESGKYENLLVNNTAVPTEAKFTNTYKRTTGNLQVGKEIVIVTEGTLIDTNQEFTFEVTLKDTALTGSFLCAVKTKDTHTTVEGSITSINADSEGKLSFNLKHNQYILIKDLPVGEYLVKELAVEGYDSSFGNISDGNQYSVDPATIKTGETTVLNCQNAYPVYYSNLIVSKTVVTPAGYPAGDTAPEDDVFFFTVSFSNYSSKVDLSKGISAKFYDSADDTTAREVALSVTDNSLSFTLKNGEWVDLNLPACTYTISETGMTSTVNSGSLEDHYTVGFTVNGTEGAAGTAYGLATGEMEKLVFTNTYKRHYGELIIEQKDMRATDSGVYQVLREDNTVLANVMLTGTESVIIRRVPVGVYTVREITGNWTWAYEDPTVSPDGAQVDLRVNASAKVTFTHSSSDPDWLHGENHKEVEVKTN